jgi:hypothetical protein
VRAGQDAAVQVADAVVEQPALVPGEGAQQLRARPHRLLTGA